MTAVTADLRLLKQLRRIDFFLSSCTSLTSVDLSGMPQLTTIGDFFLYACTSLTSVDLNGAKLSSEGDEDRWADDACVPSVPCEGSGSL